MFKNKFTWIILGITFFIIIVLTIASIIQSNGSTEQITAMLNTPLSEVKFWQFLLGIVILKLTFSKNKD